MKKILSIFTLISLVFAMCVPAFAAHTVDDFETETIGDFIYEKDTNVIYGYTGSAETVEMPAECKIASKRGIINSAPNVKKVILASGNIYGANLTGLFPNMNEIEFKEGVTEIGDIAFNFNSTDKNIQKLHLLSTHIGLHELFNSKIHLCNTMSPYDFLSEIKYSKLVITASFHCLAFAMLMKKNFIVLLTGNIGRDERLINLLRITGLSDRILTEKTTYQDLIAPIDYKKVDEILEKEIVNSKKFLQEAILNNKNENKK